MRIDRIDLYHVAMPLISPWRTAYGEDHVIESVLVRVTSGRHFGWGETCPLGTPTYSPEYAAGVFHVLKTWLAPRIVGQDIATGLQLQQSFGPIKGNSFAKAGIDLAWWDLHARMRNEPLYRTLGGVNGTITVGADFGVADSVDLLLEDVAKAVDAGFPRVKLKFRPDWDLPMVRAVRERFPKAVFHVDCNSGYRLEDAPLFQALDEFELAMIEQPLGNDDLVDHAQLQKMIRTPVCLDESVSSPDKARKAIALGSCQNINIKPARVGGMTNALVIHDLCVKHKIPCWVGGMLESAVGVAHCVALGTLPGFTYPGDIFPSTRFYREDLGTPDIVVSGKAQVAAREEPGIGVVPDADRLKRCTIQHAAIGG